MVNSLKYEMDRKRRLAKQKEALLEHDKKMTEIASRGGMTLEQMRSLSMNAKDRFILNNMDQAND
jgi:hypothetical protein